MFVRFWFVLAGLVVVCLTVAAMASAGASADLQIGLSERDLTPKLGDKPVYMAGFGQNRKATGVRDPITVRAIVFKHGEKKIAIASADLVGLFLTNVREIRKKLPGFEFVLVSSTHNHEGPDTLGLWGPTPFTSGVDPAYLAFVEEETVKAIQEADARARPALASIGTAAAPELLHDGREPFIKHDELVALRFVDPTSKKNTGILVQWNCHPETLGSANTLLSADYVHSTVRHLKEKHQCPVVYLTGTVGGLMTSLHVEIKNEQGKSLADGTFEKTDRFGQLLGKVADRALEGSKPIRLGPMSARSREVYIPLDNKMYVLASQLGVLKRGAYLWSGDWKSAEPLKGDAKGRRQAMQTEVSWLKLGELEIAGIPGEIYPELVLGKVQDPPDKGSDFPDAAIEPAVYKQLRGPYRMIVGLANDEIGYIIPKRQWDEKPPFCYGRAKSQYGEINSSRS